MSPPHVDDNNHTKPEMSAAQGWFFLWLACSVAAPLMPVAIVSQFKRGKSTNQIKNRTQLANKSDCCAACQINETARRSRSCEITPWILNSTHQIVSCYRTSRDTATWSSHVWKLFYSIMWYILADWLFMCIVYAFRWENTQVILQFCTHFHKMITWLHDFLE